MSNGFETLVTSLERRYDYQSARTIAREALALAGLKEADKYSAAELQKFVDGLAQVGSDLGAVFEAIGVTPAGTEAPLAPAAEAPGEGPKDEGKKEEAKPAPKKEEAKAPAKKAEAKAPAKKAEGEDAAADKAEGDKPAAKKAPAKKK